MNAHQTEVHYVSVIMQTSARRGH